MNKIQYEFSQNNFSNDMNPVKRLSISNMRTTAMPKEQYPTDIFIANDLSKQSSLSCSTTKNRFITMKKRNPEDDACCYASATDNYVNNAAAAGADDDDDNSSSFGDYAVSDTCTELAFESSALTVGGGHGGIGNGSASGSDNRDDGGDTASFSSSDVGDDILECSSFDIDEYSSTEDDDDEEKSLPDPDACNYIGCCRRNDYNNNHTDCKDDEHEHASHNSSYRFGDSLQSVLYPTNQDCTVHHYPLSKRVEFGSVTIREFSITIGAGFYTPMTVGTSSNSHDAGGLGFGLGGSGIVCPMELDWSHTEDSTMDIRDYACLRRSANQIREHTMCPTTIGTTYNLNGICKYSTGSNSSNHCSRSSNSSGRSGYCLLTTETKSGVRRLKTNERRERIATVQGLTMQQVQLMEMELLVEHVRHMIDTVESKLQSSSSSSSSNNPMISVFPQSTPPTPTR